jgi:transposase
MRITTTKSKNAESFYISKSFKDASGKSTSKIIRKLGTLKELSEKLNTDRDGVLAWANEQAKIETDKYRKDNEAKTVLIPFHANRQLEYGKQKAYKGGYLFLQSIYYGLKLDQTCQKIKARHEFEYDLNAILSDLVYTRILEPQSKRSSFQAAKKFLEPPSYELHDIYRALSVISGECDYIQAEVFKNSRLCLKRNENILYYDCTNYYFEIEQEEGDKRYGKSKEHRPNPIVQMGLFTDGDGMPLAFSIFPGNQNEQASLKPLETKILNEFGCDKFIYCSDAGLASESNRVFNHMGKRAFIVTQSIKKLPAEEREWALNKSGFRNISNDKKVDIENLSDEDNKGLYYKDLPYTTTRLHQRLIITYSPKYAAYQKSIRERQIERAEKMLSCGKLNKQRRNPNDPARFVGKIAATEDGEAAKIRYYLDTDKIAEEAKYDGLYAVCTDLLDDDPADIVKVSEGRWQIEACFRILKTDFSARPVFVRREDRIKAHFLVCFLSLLIYRALEKKLDYNYTCDEILATLKDMNFASIEEQGFMPLYGRQTITDALHNACGFRTDFQFITKSNMKAIQKTSKGRE